MFKTAEFLELKNPFHSKIDMF